MQPDLSPVYTTTGNPPFQMGAVLRCFEHPEWEADADGTSLPDSIRKAIDHVTTEDHKPTGTK